MSTLVVYAASATWLANTMCDMGDGIAAQCATLQRDPTAHACEQLAYNLEGARRAVLNLRERLIAEGDCSGW